MDLTLWAKAPGEEVHKAFVCLHASSVLLETFVSMARFRSRSRSREAPMERTARLQIAAAAAVAAAAAAVAAAAAAAAEHDKELMARRELEVELLDAWLKRRH